MHAVPLAPAMRVDRLQMLSTAKSLLVIEDDLSLVEFLGVFINERFPGLEWEYVSSGEKAMELIHRRAKFHGEAPYSLVMTDIFLEGETTGFDIWLECQQHYPKMPIVITSSLSFDRYFSILRGARNCPVYLPKPLTVSRCQSVLEEYL